MLALVAATTIAIVGGDKVALRTKPERTASLAQTLWKGDWLEVRGARKGWLEVYDHRHERPGWVAGKNVRVVEVDAASADALRAVVEYLRDTPGAETIGLAYAALYLKVAPRPDAGIMDAIGVMGDRVAQAASTAAGDAALEHLEVARSWGLAFRTGGADPGADDARTCYDGAAFREALALHPTPDEAATAALALTDPACAAPSETIGATERQAQAQARLAMLVAIDPTRVDGPIGDRLRLRRVTLGAELAWAIARKGELAKAAEAAQAAVDAYARVDQRELADDDAAAFQEAALALASVRWAGAPVPAADKGAPALTVTAGADAGETCLAITPAKGAASPKRCTHGQVWASSYRVAPGGGAATLAVSPLPGWLELWMFRRAADGGWMLDILAPTTDGPDLGYVEVAGWSPDHARAIVVREARTDGVVRRTFQIVGLGTLDVDKEATTLAGLGAARAWASREWRQGTVALR